MKAYGFDPGDRWDDGRDHAPRSSKTSPSSNWSGFDSCTSKPRKKGASHLRDRMDREAARRARREAKLAAQREVSDGTA